MTNHILSKFGTKSQRKKYRIFTEEELSHCKKTSDSLFKKIKRFPILGTETFTKTISEKYLTNDSSNEVSLNSLYQKQLSPIRNTDFIIKIVAEHYNVSVDRIKTINRGKHGNQPRTIAIYLSCLLSNQKLKEIAEKFTNTSCNGISQTSRRMKNELRRSISLTNNVEILKNKIMKIK